MVLLLVLQAMVPRPAAVFVLASVVIGCYLVDKINVTDKQPFLPTKIRLHSAGAAAAAAARPAAVIPASLNHAQMSPDPRISIIDNLSC
jgi:hypothetical protein